MKNFITGIINDSFKQESVAQAIYAGCKPRSILPLQFALALAMDNKYSLKWLNKFGFAMSYDEVTRFKQNVIQYENADDIVINQLGTFIQYVGDNTDHDMNTIVGKNTHHGLGSIIVINGAFSSIHVRKEKAPRNQKQNWVSVPNDEGIPIFELDHFISPLRTTYFDLILPDPEIKRLSDDLLWIGSKHESALIGLAS